MSYLQKSLSKNEELKAAFPLNYVYFFIPGVIFSLFLTSLVLVGYKVIEDNISPYLFIIPGLLFLVFLYQYLNLKSIEYGATSQRVIAKKGLFVIKTEEMFNHSIETIEIEQNLLGRIFNYGKIILTGKGNSTIILDGISNPIEAKKAIESSEFIG